MLIIEYFLEELKLLYVENNDFSKIINSLKNILTNQKNILDHIDDQKFVEKLKKLSASKQFSHDFKKLIALHFDAMKKIYK